MSPPHTVLKATTAAGDLSSRRITGLSRVLIALVVTAAASVEALPLPQWFAWVAGLAWLPAAAVLWMAEEGPASRRRTLTGMCLDLVALLSVIALAPQLAPPVMLLLIPLAAAYTYQGGARDGLLLATPALLGRWLLVLASPQVDVHPVDEIANALVTLCVILLMQRALHVRRQDARRVREVSAASETIMDRSTESILVTAPDGTILQANPAAGRVLIDPEETVLVGAGCTDRLALHEPGGRPLDCATGCALAQLCAGGDDAVEVFRWIGDARQPLLASSVPLRNELGQISHLHSFRDITTLKQADEAKTMFLATASHELKTPLTVIRGFAQLLRQTITDGHGTAALDAIESRSGELAVIIDRLLLSSRIDAGKIDLHLETFDLAELLRIRLRDLGRSLGSTVDVKIEEGLQVHASQDALATVIEHLVDNAAKYSHHEGAVAVTTRAEGSDVLIDVVDHGIGMTPTQAAQCFEKFWQAEITDVRRFGGTGIGLYIVRSLTEAMGGQVTVRSVVGSGTTFTVRVPGAPVAPPQHPTEDLVVSTLREDGPRTAETNAVDEFMDQIGLRTGRS